MLEHFYQIIDRPAVNQFLGLKWPAFHRKYGSKHPQWVTKDFLSEFFLDDEGDVDNVDRILKTRTLRWTMLRGTPQFYFMVEMIEDAPEVKKRCPQFWCQGLSAMYLFLGAASQAFLDGRLSKRTLRTVFGLHAGPGELDGLDLKKTDRRALEDALEPWEEPAGMLGWQRVRGELDGYCHLGQPDSRRFLEFVHQSWSENWPCPFLRREERADLPRKAQKTPTMRDNEIAKKLVDWLRKSKNGAARNLSLLRYFG